MDSYNTQYYQVWYKAQTQIHDMMQLAGMQGRTALAKKMIQEASTEEESKRAAEYIMRLMRFDADRLKHAHKSLGKYGVNVDSMIDAEIEHVHQACSEEIRAKWSKPYMDDKGFEDYLYKHSVGPCLADALPDVGVPRNVDIKL